jgi:predicted ribosome quality control (RQC) complex YloA/Tae2 family protein
MDIDTLTLAALRDELREALLGGRVQRVVQPSELMLGLEIYAGQRHQIVLSAESHAAGPLLVDDKPRRGVEEPTPLLLLVRKYLDGARLQGIEQPPFERLLRFSFSGPEGETVLICEVMGRLSNVILIDAEGMILDALKRVPASINRYRTILPHQLYVPPPPQEKQHPLGLSTARLRQVLEADSGPLWRRLVSQVRGISPFLAREIVFRAAGAIEPSMPLDDEAYCRLVQIVADLMRRVDSGAQEPHVGLNREGEPEVFAPYEPQHYALREPVSSMSAAILRVWHAYSSYDGYQEARARLHTYIQEGRERQAGKLAALRKALAAEADLPDLQMRGNAILALGWGITPGQAELVVDPVGLGLADDTWAGGLLRIALDPALSPAENAQALFQRYRKIRSATQQVPTLIAQTELELDYLRQLDAEVDLAQDRAQLDEVEGELREAGYLPKRGKASRPPASAPLRVQTRSGDLILVGRNSIQNQRVTFHDARPDDLWLHAHGVPGSHVIVKPAGAEPSDEALLRAAQLAAYYSAARHETQVRVDLTQRRHVRPIKGARPGMVTYGQETTLVVAPEAKDVSP